MMEITVYSCGDSRDVRTWSNVPFLMCRALERAGVKVNRVNIAPTRWFNRWFNRVSYTLWQRIGGRKECPVFARTWLHRIIINNRLKRAAKRFSDSTLNLFLSYGFINKHSNAPSVLWCDWTDRVVIERLGRLPRWYERGALRHEDKVMREAQRVYTMFPVCRDHLQELYGREVVHLGRNVVNTLYEGDEYNPTMGAIRHLQSMRLLFVGNILYRGGARQLIESVVKLKEIFPALEIDIVGMTSSQIGYNYPWLHCHGYLRKDVKDECKRYYELIMGARAFVNPTQGWGGYSSTIEAMYYGTPVIVAPYDDFVAEMGPENEFGYYTSGEDLSDQIARLFALGKEDYTKMSLAAHNRVADYTWDNYVKALLEDLEVSGLIKE